MNSISPTRYSDELSTRGIAWCWVDKTGAFLGANRAAMAMLDADPATLRPGATVDDLMRPLPEEPRPLLQQLFARIGRGEYAFRDIPFTFETVAGQIKRARFDANVVLQPEGAGPTLQIFCRDCSMVEDESDAASAADVLVVDDDPEIRQLLLEILESEGYGVRLCEDATQALAEIRNKRPHLIITDLSMPGIDGTDLVRTLRTNPVTQEMPILVVSGFLTDADKRELATLGVAATLDKPFSMRRLVEQCQLCLRNKPGR